MLTLYTSQSVTQCCFIKILSPCSPGPVLGSGDAKVSSSLPLSSQGAKQAGAVPLMGVMMGTLGSWGERARVS